MIRFLAENWGTILVTALIVALVAGIIIKLIIDKKKGKTSCSCGCENCASASVCHKKKD